MPRRPPGLLRWFLVAIAVVVVAGAAFAGYTFLRPSVVVTKVVEGPVVEAFYATGTLQASREYEVRSSAAGIIRKPDVERPYVDKGHAVTEGEALAVVADPQLQFAFDKAAAELDEKRKRADEHDSPVLQELDAKVLATDELLEVAKREETRMTKLLESGGSSQADFDKALDRAKTVWMDRESYKAQRRQMLLSLKRDLDVAQAALTAAKSTLDLQVVRSPVAGVVLDRPVSLGTRVNVNDRVLLVADVRPANLVVRAQVDEENVTKVRVGQRVQMALYAFRGQPFQGTVAKVYEKADPDRRTFEVDVKPTNPDPGFAAGMTGELAFEVRNKASALVVPSQAVQDGKVWVLRKNRLHAIPAEVGVRGVERTELAAGVRVGDEILVGPAAGLRDGQAVRPRPLDPIAAAAMNKPKEKELFRGGF